MAVLGRLNFVLEDHLVALIDRFRSERHVKNTAYWVQSCVGSVLIGGFNLVLRPIIRLRSIHLFQGVCQVLGGLREAFGVFIFVFGIALQHLLHVLVHRVAILALA